MVPVVSAAATAIVPWVAYKLSQTSFGSSLSQFTTDLTELAKQGKLKRAFGRERELAEAQAALSGHGVLILTGEPGVGKTALVEEMAARAAGQSIPSLHGVRILKLDFEKISGNTGGLSSLIGSLWGTRLHDYFKKLFNELLAACNQKGQKTVLFIDEFSRLIQECPFIFNAFLDKLDRNVVVVGATTAQEGVQTWLHSMARLAGAEGLRRRVTILHIPELSFGEACAVLKQDRSRFQEQGVQIADEAIDAAASLAPTYKPEGKYPHHAIELLEHAITHAKDQGKTEITRADVIDYLHFVRSLPRQRLETAAAGVKAQSDTLQRFPELCFPYLAALPATNPEVEELADHLAAHFSQSGLKANLIGASPALLQSVAEAIEMRSPDGKPIHLVRCSIQALTDMAKTMPGGVELIDNAMALLKERAAGQTFVVYIEDGHLLIPALTPAASSEGARARLEGAVLREMAALAGRLPNIGANVSRLLEANLEPAAPTQAAPKREAAPEASPVITKVLNGLRDNHLPYILALPPSFEGRDSDGMTLRMRELHFSELEAWLEERFPQIERALVRPLLYTIYHCRPRVGNKVHPADVAVEVLSSSRTPSTPQSLQELLIQKSPGLRRADVVAAWEGTSHLEAPIFALPPPVLAAAPDVARIADTFLGDPSHPMLCVEEDSPARRAFIRDQLHRHFHTVKRPVCRLDLSPIQHLAPELQQMIFLSQAQRQNPQAGTILILEEDLLAQPHIRTTVQQWIHQQRCQLVCLRPSRKAPAGTTPESALERGAQLLEHTVQQVTGLALPPPPTPPIPTQTPGFENLRCLSYTPPPFTPEQIPPFVAPLLPAALTAAAAQALTRIYTAYPQTPDILRERLRQDAAYFTTRSTPPTPSDLIDYLSQTLRIPAPDLAYAVDPTASPRTYRLRRTLTAAAQSFGSLLLGPLAFAYNHLSTLSIGLFTIATMRSLFTRIVGFFVR